MSPSPLRFGLVGAGGIAQAYAQAFASTDAADLVAVADTRPDAVEAMANSSGARGYASHQALALNGACDAVIVCTPPNVHPEICHDLFRHELPVLCEKPLSIDAPTARQMVAAAHDAGLLFTMASKFRYVEDVVKAKHIVDSGELGEIVLCEVAFTSRVDMTRRWNSRREISGGGVLIDNGTHGLDIIRYLLGPIAEVQALEGKRVQGLDVEETVRVFVRSQSGVHGSIDLSWSVNKERDTYIEIFGSEGTVKVGWQESRYHQTKSDEWIVFGQGYDKVQAFRGQIENFAAAIRGDEPLLINGVDGIASVEAVETAYEALHSNSWVRVSSACDGTMAREKVTARCRA